MRVRETSPSSFPPSSPLSPLQHGTIPSTLPFLGQCRGNHILYPSPPRRSLVGRHGAKKGKSAAQKNGTFLPERRRVLEGAKKRPMVGRRKTYCRSSHRPTVGRCDDLPWIGFCPLAEPTNSRLGEGVLEAIGLHPSLPRSISGRKEHPEPKIRPYSHEKILPL